ncbi:MAG: alpha/beta hydrolase [Acidimicrobiia bacterium]
MYTPAGDAATDRPVVIWAHGGGFITGDKSSDGDWALEFAKRGYVAASINYRMDEDGPQIRYPIDAGEYERIFWAVSDMKAAIRWFRANAASLGIDPNRIAVAGASAGAVMSLTTSATAQDAGDTGDHLGYSSAVCTAVSVSGATEPTLIDSGDTGAIFFHGDADTVVPFSLAEATRDAMVAAGLPVEFNVYAGEGHGIGGPHRDEIRAKTYSWLFNHLVNAPQPCL